MSIQKEFALYVPIKGESVKSVGNVVQNDTGGNKIIIRLTDGKNPIDLTGYTNITFSVLKPDGTYVVDSLGDRIAVVDALQGAVSVVLHDNAINMAGSCMATIEVFSGTTRVTSARLSFVVTADLTAGADPSSDSSYPILLSLITDVTTLETNVETAESSRVTAETGRVTAESGRTTAEGLRVTAEEGRAAAESTRVSSETARSDAEGLRAAAETTRLSNESGRVSAESGRASAESSRSTAETGRVNAESSRASAESGRVTAETSRSSAEGIRASAEITRLGNENTRSSAEEGRVLAENDRVSDEGLRNTAESGRVSAEESRVSAENLRESAETARQFVGNYDAATAYVIGNNVAYNGSSYRCIADCIGIVPTNTANWILVATKGLDGEGSGDMLAATYDPVGKAADVYDMSNMVEGVTNKILTATERTKLAVIEEGANAYTHPSTHSADMIVDGTSNKVYTATEKTKLAGIASEATKVLISNNLTETVAGKALDATQGKALNDLVSTVSGEVTAHKDNNTAHNLVWSKIEKVVLSVDSAQVNINIPDGYEFLQVVALTRSTNVTADANLLIRFNDDAGLNYGFSLTNISISGAVSKSNLNSNGLTNFIVKNIATLKKVFAVTGANSTNTSVINAKGEWLNITNKITKISFNPSADMFKAGCEFHVWGAK